MGELTSTDRLNGILFSMDRAMQLDAALRSFYQHAIDGDAIELTIIYRATNERHARQYRELRLAYQDIDLLHFVEQRHFRQEVLAVLGWGAQLSGGRPVMRLYARLAGLHRRLGFLARPLLRFPDTRYILFLVDDNIFVRDFRLGEAVSALERSPHALGFSLRLGRNTTHCYTMGRAQALPAFTAAGDGILSFDWTAAELDFHYPLEVSSSIYRIPDLLPFLNGHPFANPNQLESRLADNWACFTHKLCLLCYETSVTFCNPVNKVQQAYQNKAGERVAYSSEDLAGRFDTGERIDVAAFDGFTPQGCHQEVALPFARKDAALQSSGESDNA